MRIAIAAVVLSVVGCAKKADDARTKQCSALYSRLVQASVALGAEDPGPEAKAAFMTNCKAVTEDLLPCLADPENAPDCAAKLRAQQQHRAGPAPKLTWKTVEVDHGRASASIPVGWTYQDFRGDTYTPPKDAKLGFFTELRIGSSCGGTCEALPAAEWAKRVEADVFVSARAGFVVDKDEALGATGHLLVTHNGPDSPSPVDTHVVAAFWADGGEQYVTCTAELDDELAAALPEFEKACRGVTVKSFSASEP